VEVDDVDPSFVVNLEVLMRYSYKPAIARLCAYFHVTKRSTTTELSVSFKGQDSVLHKVKWARASVSGRPPGFHP
jgi:hypothetical protein